MKIILKNIIYMARRFKTATAFNLIGLVVAFAAFYLLLAQIIYQASYNHGVTDYQRIYRMEANYLYKEHAFSEHVCRPFADALRRLPEVESYSLARNINLDNDNHTFPYLKGNHELEYDLTRCNNTAVSTLTDRVVDGSIEWTDEDLDGIIIPASIAIQYFDTIQAAGKEMLLLYRDQDLSSVDTIPIKVRGVFEDFPDNSELWNCIYMNMGSQDIMDFNAHSKCFIKFKAPLEDSEATAQAIKQAILDELNDSAKSNSKYNLANIISDVERMSIKLTPIKDTYLESSSFTNGEHGYRGAFFFMALACCMIIIIATINFLNFTLAESPLRIRSLNTRLVLGAKRGRLRLCVIAECVVVALFACMLGIALCNALTLLSHSSLLSESGLMLHNHWSLVLYTIGVAVLVGIVAGVYPAFFATSFPPAMALKGSFGLSVQGRKLSTAMVALQLFISMLMVSYLGILLLQSHYIFNSPCGYNKDKILTVSLPYPYINENNYQALYRELMKLPKIESASLSSAILGSTDGPNVIKAYSQRKIISFNFMIADQDYLRTMEIPIIEGRDFADNDSDVVIINEAAKRQWNWLKPGARISGSIDETGDSAIIIGVCDDIRYGSTRILNNQPFLFFLERDLPGLVLNLRINQGVSQETAKHEINDIIQQFCDGKASPPMSYNQLLNNIYHNELRFFKLVYILCFFCLVITLIGVFCLTMFETEYRRKEIGVRKVAGATTREIIWMLCRQYLPLILISFVIATPLAYYLGVQTLKNFAQRAVTQWWIFPLSLFIVGGITLGTVVLQSWRAAHENPSNSIRTE